MTSHRVKIVIDSLFRDASLYPNPSRFQVSLSAPLTDVRGVSLGNCRIPVDNGAPPSTRPSYVAVCIEDIPGLWGTVQQTEMPPFSGSVLGYVFLHDTSVAAHYAYSSGEPLWSSSTRMSLPRLQSFKISLQVFDAAAKSTVPYPMPDHVDGGPNQNWFATLCFDCAGAN